MQIEFRRVGKDLKAMYACSPSVLFELGDLFEGGQDGVIVCD